MKFLVAIFISIIFLDISGCASITESTSQSVSVQTYQKGVQVTGASCTLQNNKGSWTVTTPGSVVLHKSFGDISANCTKTGYDSGGASYKSSSNLGVWGNVLIGGGIGAIIDGSNGAGYNYPDLFKIEMGMVKTVEQTQKEKEEEESSGGSQRSQSVAAKSINSPAPPNQTAVSQSSPPTAQADPPPMATGAPPGNQQKSSP